LRSFAGRLRLPALAVKRLTDTHPRSTTLNRFKDGSRLRFALEPR
jgi:hypothetical protein